jgi:hypothetical protein
LLAGAAIAAWRIPSIDVPFVSEDHHESAETDVGGVHGEQPCTLVGCTDPAISVATSEDVEAALPGARRMLACVDVHCSLTELQAEHRLNVVTVPIPYRRVRPVRVEVQVQTRDGEVLDRQVAHGMLHHEFPNGRSCGPECINLLFAYDPVRGDLSASAAALKRQGLGHQYGTTR